MTPRSAEPVLAHVLFMDIVGCSRLPSDEQTRIITRLREIVSNSEQFRSRSGDANRLISLPTGDGMALAFFDKLDAAMLCAIEVTKSIQAETLCAIRMGIHTGTVFVVEDINNNRNVSGTGINLAERVMSCGDAGHILLSDNGAEALRHLSAWRDKLTEIGECEVKDGWVRVWNFVDGAVGNPQLPRRAKQSQMVEGRKRRTRSVAAGSVVAVILVVLALLARGVIIRHRGASPAGGTPSIAVLPFENLSGEKGQEYFSDGLAEELLNSLAKVPGLRVVGRTSSFRFKDRIEDPRVVGEKLRVAHLLEGSVRKQGNRTRVVTQLVAASDGEQLWSEIFDRETTDIFAVQEEIAKAVAGALKVKLLDEHQPSSGKTTSAEAYSDYLQGRYFGVRRNRDNLEKAVNYFQEALRLDPNYAPAWVGLGECRAAQAGSAYIPVEDGYRQARKALGRALSLQRDLGPAHVALGWIKMSHDWDWPGAQWEFEKALTDEPENADALGHAGELARVLGDTGKAIVLYERAVEADPLNVLLHNNVGLVYLWAGRQQQAEASLKKALELAPEMWLVHCYLGRLRLSQSQPEAALEEMQKEKHPAFRVYGLALAYHALGKNSESEQALQSLIGEFAADAPFQIAEVYAYRGQTKEAFHWLDRALDLRDPGITQMRGDPLLASLEKDARYSALLRRVGLPE